MCGNNRHRLWSGDAKRGSLPDVEVQWLRKPVDRPMAHLNRSSTVVFRPREDFPCCNCAVRQVFRQPGRVFLVPEASSRQFGNPPLIFRNLVSSLLFLLSVLCDTRLLSSSFLGMLKACSKRVWSDRAIGHRHELQPLNRRPLLTSFLQIGFTRFHFHLTFRAIKR